MKISPLAHMLTFRASWFDRYCFFSSSSFFYSHIGDAYVLALMSVRTRMEIDDGKGAM